jgi:hypothetical protein
MNEQTLDKSWALTPGQEVEVNASGRFMYVEQCDGPVTLALDDGSPFKIRSGFEFVNRDFSKFRLISKVGAGGATVTVKIYAGNIYVSNRNPVVFTRPAPVYDVPLNQSITNTPYNIPNTNLRTGQTVADKQRKVRVENLGTGASIDVRIGTTKVAELSAISAGAYERIFEWETPDTITLYSTGGSTAGIIVSYELPT